MCSHYQTLKDAELLLKKFGVTRYGLICHVQASVGRQIQNCQQLNLKRGAPTAICK